MALAVARPGTSMRPAAHGQLAILGHPSFRAGRPAEAPGQTAAVSAAAQRPVVLPSDGCAWSSSTAGLAHDGPGFALAALAAGASVAFGRRRHPSSTRPSRLWLRPLALRAAGEDAPTSNGGVKKILMSTKVVGASIWEDPDTLEMRIERAATKLGIPMTEDLPKQNVFDEKKVRQRAAAELLDAIEVKIKSLETEVSSTQTQLNAERKLETEATEEILATVQTLKAVQSLLKPPSANFDFDATIQEVYEAVDSTLDSAKAALFPSGTKPAALPAEALSEALGELSEVVISTKSALSEIGDMQGSAEQAEKAMQELKKEREQAAKLREELATQKETMAALQQQLGESKNFEEQLAKQTEAMSALEQQLVETKAVEEQLRDDLRKAKESKAQPVAQAEADMSGLVEELNRTKEQLAAELEEKDQLIKEKANLAQSEADKAGLVEELNKTKEQLAANLEEKDQLIKEKANLAQSGADKSGLVEELNKTKERLAAELEEKDQLIKEKAHLAQSEADKAGLVDELNKTKEQLAANLEEKDQLIKEKGTLTTEKENLLKEQDKLLEAVVEAQQKREDLKEIIEAQRETAKQTAKEIEELKQQNTGLQKTEIDLRLDLSNAEEFEQDLREELKKKIDTEKSLQGQLSKEKDRGLDLQMQLSKASADLNAAVQAKTELDETMKAKLKKQEREFSEAEEKLKAELADLSSNSEQQLAKMQEELQAVSEELAMEKDKTAELTASSEELKLAMEDPSQVVRQRAFNQKKHILSIERRLAVVTEARDQAEAVAAERIKELEEALETAQEIARIMGTRVKKGFIFKKNLPLPDLLKELKQKEIELQSQANLDEEK